MKMLRAAKRSLAFAANARKIGASSAAAYYSKARDTLVPIHIAGERIITRARSRDLRVVVESLTREYTFLDDILPRDFDGLVVDAGGYIGTAAIAFASRFPKATIVTIEPSSANLEILKRNVAVYPNIHVRHAALSDTAGGKTILHDRKTGEWGFTIIADDASNGDPIEEIARTSLEEIKREFGMEIAFLKLDIEGGEKPILEGNDDQLQDIPLIFVELHDRIVAGCSSAFRLMSRDRWIVRLGGEKFLSIRRGN